MFDSSRNRLRAALAAGAALCLLAACNPPAPAGPGATGPAPTPIASSTPPERSGAAGLTASDEAAAPSEAAAPAPIRVAAWNANSGVDSDRGTHDAQLDAVATTVASWFQRGDVVALSEVAPHWMDTVENRADEVTEVGAYRGTTGCNQGLMILFREDRFEAFDRHEMTGVPDGRRCVRAPILVGLRDRASGLEFDVVVAHLIRGSRDEGPRARAAEADRLRRLLDERGDRPVIVVGDFNADCPLDRAPAGCADAFHALVEGDFLAWRAPSERRETTCSTRYDDMLDLVFVGRGARDWPAEVRVADDREFCDRMQRGAHFPVFAEFSPGG